MSSLQLPPTISIPSPDYPEWVSSYNASEYHLNNSWKLRLLRIPGNFFDDRPSKGLHEIQLSLGPEWFKAQQKCPSIGPACFVRVHDMVDPSTGAPTVALMSPFYKKGNILQAKATKQRKIRWLIQICEALRQLHALGLVHGNVHPRNILIRDDDAAVLTDACLYSLIVEHYIAKMSHEAQSKLGRLETLSCKTAAAVQEYGGRIPSTKATKANDIFGLAMAIWMVYQGKEPWSGPRVPALVLEGAHRGLPKPDNMKDRLWGTLHAIFSQNGAQTPTIEVIKQRLGEEIAQ